MKVQAPRRRGNFPETAPEIHVPATLRPCEFFAVVQRWFDGAELGSDLVVKVRAGCDEDGFSGVLIQADAADFGQTIYSLVSSSAAGQIANELEQLLPQLIGDELRLDVYSGMIVALREAACFLRRERRYQASRGFLRSVGG